MTKIIYNYKMLVDDNVIYVKTLTGKMYPINVMPNDTIKTLKNKFEETTEYYGIMNGARLIYNGKILDDDKTLEEYKIKQKDQLNLVCALR